MSIFTHYVLLRDKLQTDDAELFETAMCYLDHFPDLYEAVYPAAGQTPLSYRRDRERFLSVLNTVIAQQRHMMRHFQSRLAVELGLIPETGLPEIGYALFSRYVDAGGSGQPAPGSYGSYNANMLLMLAEGEYTIYSAFYDSVHCTGCPALQRIEEAANTLSGNEDLFLVPLNLHK